MITQKRGDTFDGQSAIEAVGQANQIVQIKYSIRFLNNLYHELGCSYKSSGDGCH